MTPQYPCPHPYFSEYALAFAAIGLYAATGLFVLGGLVWIGTRRLALAGTVAAIAVATLAACYAVARWGDELIMRVAFGTDDWTRLQHELQAREADLAQ